MAVSSSISQDVDPNAAGWQGESFSQPKNVPQAFHLFSSLSDQLNRSYQMLEDHVKYLTLELETSAEQREDELQEKQNIACRLDGLLELLPGGVVVLSSRGTVEQCNPAAVDLLSEPLIGQAWSKVILRAFSPQSNDGCEVSLKDGRLLAIATKPLQQQRGQIILLTDQTSTRKLQQKVSRQERFGAMGKMMAYLAHQLRTPLSAAMLYSGQISDSLPQAKRLADKSLSRLHHMEQKINDMLVFAKGELPLSDCVAAVELMAVVKQSVASIRFNDNVNLNITKDLQANLYLCNQEVLASAVVNLVNNAQQAMPKGGDIQLQFVEQNSQLLIKVLDRGPGLDTEFTLKAIQQHGELVSGKSNGFGFGLALVNTVVNAHQGLFELLPRQGGGLVAQITLPAVSAPQ